MDKKNTFTPTRKLVKSDGTVMYIFDGKLHNEDGPALIPEGKNADREYYLFGIQYTEFKWNSMMKDKEGLPWYKNPSMQAKLGTSRF